MKVMSIVLALCSPIQLASGMAVPNSDLSKLRQFTRHQGYTRSSADLQKFLDVSTELGDTCMPGVFSKHDFLAIAFQESRFNPRAVGSFKERGAWQILKWKSHLARIKATDAFDIETSGRMACDVLREKYRTHKDYAKSIQAYNGYRKTMKTLPYYRKVSKIRNMLKGTLHENH